ncbi:MAG: hypothetical protein ACXV3S_04620, partial [Kineosporiaceae bacterium]
MVEVVHRTPRRRPPAPNRTAFAVQAPPAVDPPAALQPVQLLVPLLGSLSILVYGVMARTPVLLVTGGIMALASMASPVVLHWTGRRLQRSKLAARRERYRAHLQELTSAAEHAKAQLAAAKAETHPSHRGYDEWLEGGRLWERGRDDPDVADVRIGTADLPTGFAVTLHGSRTMDVDPDAELTDATAAFERLATVLEDSALVLRLAGPGVVALTGERAAALGLVRAILLELALTSAPDDMRLIAAFPPDDLSAWEWAKWLPHTAPAGADPGSERMLVSSVPDLERHLNAIAASRLSGLAERIVHTAPGARPRAVLVIDRFDPLTELGVSATLAHTLAHAETLGITVLTLPPSSPQAPTETSILITMGSAGGEATSSTAVLRRLREPFAAPVDFTPLAVDSADAERVARR